MAGGSACRLTSPVLGELSCQLPEMASQLAVPLRRPAALARHTLLRQELEEPRLGEVPQLGTGLDLRCAGRVGESFRIERLGRGALNDDRHRQTVLGAEDRFGDPPDAVQVTRWDRG